MKTFVSRQLAYYLRQPYAPLFPLLVLSVMMLLAWYVVHTTALNSAEHHKHELQNVWERVRQQFARHKDAMRAKGDLRQVWAVFPLARDFAPLALGVTEEAKRDHITLPALSYKTESTPIPDATKAVLQGTVTGHYGDVRRFLYNLESAEELLFIEDLNLVRSGHLHDSMLTFNIRIATYLRGEPTQVLTLDADDRIKS
jgi:Tfp pilus assembly protein PilO